MNQRLDPQHISTVAVFPPGFGPPEGRAPDWDADGICHCETFSPDDGGGMCQMCHRLLISSVDPKVLGAARCRRPYVWVEHELLGWIPVES